MTEAERKIQNDHAELIASYLECRGFTEAAIIARTFQSRKPDDEDLKWATSKIIEITNRSGGGEDQP